MIADFLVKAGVRHVAGIPGHGIWTVLDAFLDYPDLNVVQVLHEQSARTWPTGTTGPVGIRSRRSRQSVPARQTRRLALPRPMLIRRR